MPDDINGIWCLNETSYYNFTDDNRVENLKIEYQDGQSIGKWGYDEVFFYEPGYKLVVYLTSDHEADVYEVIELTSSRLVWCWVDEIHAPNMDSIGQVIGDIINKAQEGFHLDPELYQTFTKISEDKFLKVLESLDVIYNPWEYSLE